ncbi:MAG: choice-of-anchor Q domain-containing protein [Planctomycetia bacterium]|nr:choice-of-anchor Q domain-containing protein [Planctomycetia bacterium]
MSFRFYKNSSRCFSRRATFELLESREMLDGFGLLDEVRSVWSDFSVSNNANIYEIEASDLSANNLRAALNEAVNSSEDDLIILRTAQDHHSLSIDEEFRIAEGTKGTITIVSMGTMPLTIDAQGHSRIFNFQGETLQLGGLILTGGCTNTDLNGTISSCGIGGGLVNTGNLSLSHVSVENCSAGGLFESNSNYASSFSMGGGIYNSGSLTLADSVLSSNTALSSESNNSKTTAYGMGGAVYNEGGTIVIRNTEFRANTAQAELVPYQFYLGDNLETGFVQQEGIGGALYSNGGSISITGGSFRENRAWNGGGLLTERTVLICSHNVRFEQNSAESSGGAVLIQGQNSSNVVSSFDRCEFLGNTANNTGGAIFTRTALNVSNSIISGNDAGINGGGCCFDGSHAAASALMKIEIINCTITGNRSGTISSGSGAGIYFSGPDVSNDSAKLYLKNSILIMNKDVTVSASSNDPNLALKNPGTDYSFGYNTLTSFTGWKSKQMNPVYDPAVSPFLRDYNFETKVQGDYHLDYSLVPAENHPAIEKGNNSFLNLNSYPYDFDGNERVYGSNVDLGAYEYHASNFDSAFPLRITVQEGCCYSLVSNRQDLNGNAITSYYADLDHDGVFEISGPNLLFTWDQIVNQQKNGGSIVLSAENILGERSETRLVPIIIEKGTPAVLSEMQSFANDQVLRLAITVNNFGRAIQNWTIDWGDNSKNTNSDYLSFSYKCAHYYKPASESKVYTITLTITDNTASKSKTAFYLGTHTVPADLPTASQYPDLSIIEEERQEEVGITPFSDKTEEIAAESMEWLPFILLNKKRFVLLDIEDFQV